MNYFFLALESTLPFKDRAIEALKVTAIGLVTIFAVLGILWLALLVFGSVAKSKYEKGNKTVQTPLPDTDDLPEQTSSDEEIAAAITAAVAIIFEQENQASDTKKGFRVVSFRRSGNVMPWTKK